MRSPLPLVVSLLLVPVSVFAQEPAATAVTQDVLAEAPANQPPQARQTYVIELVEFSRNKLIMLH